MDARSFLERFVAVLDTAWTENAPQRRATWTQYISERLHTMATAAQLISICQHQHPERPDRVPGQPERMCEVLFDFCWYTDEGHYSLPCVIVEHENGTYLNDFLYDL